MNGKEYLEARLRVLLAELVSVIQQLDSLPTREDEIMATLRPETLDMLKEISNDTTK